MNTIVMPPPGFSSDSAKKGSHFCKLVIPSMLQEQQQEVPAEFVDALRGCWAYLSLPKDLYWTVKLRKKGNKVWFHGGWSEYLQVLSVCVGFLMVFEYQGESKFKVFVFDIRDTQINLMHHMLMSNASLNHASACTCSPAPTPPSFLTLLDQKPFSLITQNSTNNVNDNAITRRWRHVSEEEKWRAVLASGRFHSLYPFFKVTMKPSYVYKGYSLHIPTKFAKKHLRVGAEMIRLMYEGREWGVKIGFGRACRRLTKGWTQFAWHTRLEVHDVCVFEMIRPSASGIVFMVTIFRVLQLAKPILPIPNQTYRIGG